MLFWGLVEYLVMAGILAFAWTQILFPLIRETPLFPFFRRERQLRRELTELRQEEVELNLERKVDFEKQVRAQQRKPNKGDKHS